MPLNLPPIPGKTPPPENNADENDEDFDFESIPFKADYMYTDPAKVKEILQSGKKTLGEPAASLTWGIDGNRAIPALTAGIEGEKQTASLLDRLARENKDLFVFHSLSWPESAGDTDHVLLYGNLLLIIDSKRWKSARKYSIKPNGTIMRGTVPFESGRVKIGSAVKVWRKKFPSLNVYGIVTIAQEKVYVTRDSNWYKAPYRLVEHDKLEEFLGEMFEKHKPTGNPSGKILTELGLLLVKARDKREGLIRVGAERRENDHLFNY